MRMKIKNYALLLALTAGFLFLVTGETVVLQNGLSGYTGCEDAKLIYDIEYFLPAKGKEDVLAIGNFTC